MRFLEIASPEDQLALWKLVSDKVWAAFAQQLPQASAAPVKPPPMGQGRAAIPAMSVAKHLPNAPAKTEKKSTGKPKRRAAKATRAPMALLNTSLVLRDKFVAISSMEFPAGRDPTS